MIEFGKALWARTSPNRWERSVGTFRVMVEDVGKMEWVWTVSEGDRIVATMPSTDFHRAKALADDTLSKELERKLFEEAKL